MEELLKQMTNKAEEVLTGFHINPEKSANTLETLTGAMMKVNQILAIRKEHKLSAS